MDTIFCLGDEIGGVRLENHIGGDESVVRAARVSYGKSSSTPERDKKLISYMLQNKHGSPFEHNSFTFHIRAPLFVVRQWQRTRIGVSYNEISGRYTEMVDSFYIPKIWRVQDAKNKQGSAGALNNSELLSAELKKDCEESYRSYLWYLSQGVAKEMARMVLPVNLYTEFYFTCNARSLMYFIALRSEQHAQWEIQQYSNSMWKFFAEIMPWTAEAFLQTLDLGKYCSTVGSVPGPNYDDVRREVVR